MLEDGELTNPFYFLIQDAFLDFLTMFYCVALGYVFSFRSPFFSVGGKKFASSVFELLFSFLFWFGLT